MTQLIKVYTVGLPSPRRSSTAHIDRACVGLERTREENVLTAEASLESISLLETFRPCRLCALEEVTVFVLSADGAKVPFLCASRRPDELREKRYTASDEFVSPATARIENIAKRTGLRSERAGTIGLAWGDVPTSAVYFLTNSFWSVNLAELFSLPQAAACSENTLGEALSTFFTLECDQMSTPVDMRSSVRDNFLVAVALT